MKTVRDVTGKEVRSFGGTAQGSAEAVVPAEMCDRLGQRLGVNGLRQSWRLPERIGKDGRAVIAGQEQEGDAARGQQFGYRKAPLAIQIDVQDGAIEFDAINLAQGLLHRGGGPDHLASRIRQLIAKVQRDKERILDDENVEP
ncbi:hypothetical protein [Mesorhizobium sp. M4B.F.Ca.ET.169.01.1.1]|uniref:hypothetical protein n=1 Tax=Mesorhizobium sp. M4B.F.Ca.ET.169.01.1.1 TaxID=2563949 RepID=UPI0016776DA5|nr:hypothetical protein [Mesorhizobium sp. M4B.F.Ca.ET.169.01.1.1]